MADETASLIERAEDDRLQQRLQAGFERTFIESVIEQWYERRFLTERQIETLEEILERHGG